MVKRLGESDHLRLQRLFAGAELGDGNEMDEDDEDMAEEMVDEEEGEEKDEMDD